MKKSTKHRFSVLSAAVATTMVIGSLAQDTRVAMAAGAAAAPPPLAPLGEVPIPPDNKQSPEKIELGKILFFDPRIGGDASTGCSTCHESDQGWAWAEDFSRGYPGTVHWRNSQTIVNSGYYPRQFWAGSASSNEKQARSAARGGVAGNGEADIMEARLAVIPEYVEGFRKVFGSEWPHIRDAWRAISAFERTLNTTGEHASPVDKYLAGDQGALDEQQKKGLELFNGKAGCINCHNGSLTTDLDYHNIGVPPNKRWEEDGLAQITFRFEQYAKGQSEEGYRTAKSDWWIISQLGKRMGFDGFDWKDSNEVCEESSRFSRGNRKAYHMIKVAAHKEGKTLHQKLRELGTTGIQGPTFYNYETGELMGSERLHDTELTPEKMAKEGRSKGANMVNKKMTHFNSQTGRVNIQKHPWSLYSDYWEWMKPKDDELWHTNGRINEIWQSGFDDVERRPYITQRWPDNFVEIHPDDAASRGIESDDMVLMYSERVPNHVNTIKGVYGNDFQFSELMKNGHIELSKAAVEAVAIVTPAVKKGTMYS